MYVHAVNGAFVLTAASAAAGQEESEGLFRVVQLMVL